MNNKNKFILLGVIVLVAAVVVGGFWWMQGREIVSEIAPGEALTTAQGNNVVSEFPQELILEKDAAVAASYRIDYSSTGVAQPVAVYDSKLTLEDNLATFRAYFAQNGWNLVQEGDVAQAPVTFIYARNDKADANVTFESAEDGKVRVTIAYFVKK
jgi:hypothetical protein